MLRRHAPAVKRDAFHLQARALLQRRAHPQLDFAPDARHALPGQGLAALPQQPRYKAVIERIAGRRRHGGIGGGLAFGD